MKTYQYRRGEVEILYDSISTIYDSQFQPDRYLAPAAVRMHLSETFFAANGKPRILDIGIGTGLLSEQFRAQYPLSHISGVDASFDMLKLCEKKNIADALGWSDVERRGLGYDDNSFDIVVSSGAFELITNQARVIAEIGRVLKPAGAFSFTTVSSGSMGANDNVYYAEDLDRFISEAGLTLNDRVEITGYTMPSGPVKYFCNTGTKQDRGFIVPEM